MDYRKNLFSYNKLYDLEGSNSMFLHAMKGNIAFHRANCPDYDKILTHFEFREENLKSIDDLYLIPPIPTTFYKTHELASIDEKKMLIKSTSSGTSGNPSRVGLDFKTCWYGFLMLKRTLSYHHLFSVIPTNYIVLGYQRSKSNKMGATKTAFGGTFLAPALHREYALKRNGTGYDINLEGIRKSLQRYEKQKLPVRFVGFPYFLFFMIQMLNENNIKLKLHPKSQILLGGGWKQFSGEKVDKRELYKMAEETLGIKQHNIKEVFAVVESNILYCDCPNHHFHVPVYGRIVIRDSKTLEPVPYGVPGLLNLLSPLVGSHPLGSIMTDDIAVLHDGKSCGCGIEAPYFEILGRVGMKEIKTCAAGANEVLEGGS